MSWKRSRCRKPLTLKKLKLRLTDAITKMEEIVMTDDDKQARIQAANTMAGLVNRYSKLLEITDLEERISKLEEAAENNKMRKVS